MIQTIIFVALFASLVVVLPVLTRTPDPVRPVLPHGRVSVVHQQNKCL